MFPVVVWHKSKPVLPCDEGSTRKVGVPRGQEIGFIHPNLAIYLDFRLL